MQFRAGLAQIAPVLGDIPANLALHLDAVEMARSQDVQLLVFPELALTGYHVGQSAYDLAIRTDVGDPVFASLLAASQKLDLVVSFIEEDDRFRFYITAAYLSGGQLIHRHRKVYLPTYGDFDEGRFFAAGRDVRSFDTRFGRFGLLICEDLWHASLPYLLWLDGADYLIGISASLEHGLPEDELSTAGRVDVILRSYAILHTLFVLHANRAGTEKGFRYWGGSTIFDPGGERLVQGPPDKPAIVCADLDPGRLRAARIGLPLLRDERPDLTAQTLARIHENRS